MCSKCSTMIQVISISILLLQSAVNSPIPLYNEDIQEPTRNCHSTVQPCGEGLFRDPLEILGDKFTEARILHLCKADVYMFADVISDVFFSPCGIKLCKSVCDGYQESMNIDVTVNVSLINSNCDYTGATTIVERLANCTHLAKCPDLSTACVCYYNVRCDRRTKAITYTFTPNRQGYLRVMVTDSGTPVYIT
ncbi:uncharacterized protein LOC111043173 [Myzus persicae]|uniref:uncharacterized protein LOC111043173 n=1 Tax=Myzus persicae TaxID=13164 RepID=UPI000B9355A3|nr:uncharacterized protein LOC111043173 [Myzus persicae]